MIDTLRNLLITIGFPVLQSIEESDYLIASLSKANIIQAAFSTDTDLCIYGIEFLLTDFYQNRFTVLDRKCLLENIEFTHEQLIDLAILLGTDYNNRISGVGKKRAFELIETFGKLELIPAKYKQKDLRRTVIRRRFKEIPQWNDLVEWEKSSIGDANVESLVFSERRFAQKAFACLQKYGLSHKWEEIMEEIRIKRPLEVEDHQEE